MNKKAGLPVFLIALDGLGSIVLAPVLLQGDTQGRGRKTENVGVHVRGRYMRPTGSGMVGRKRPLTQKSQVEPLP